MIILDTNVLSALMTPALNPEPLIWLDKQPQSSIWTTAVNIFESLSGIRLLPTGKRRQSLEAALDEVIATILADRILPFDRDAAEAAATIAGRRVSRGSNVGARD